MWTRFADYLRCPRCSAGLQLHSFRDERIALTPEHASLAAARGLKNDTLNQYVHSGVLLCSGCATYYPVAHGVPVLTLYATPLHSRFSVEFKELLAPLIAGYKLPDTEPPKGERFVMASFSQEWKGYDYDGVLWSNNYSDHEKMFLAELGISPGGKDKCSSYLEIGCGLGIATSLAQQHLAYDAVGVDLSTACFQAAQHFRTNPFLHFVQASAFHLPFRRRSFDVIYSRGVLHHTYSTREAFRAVAEFCAPSGRQYIWVYGPGSMHGNLFRTGSYLLEQTLRPVLSQCSSSLFAKSVLTVLTLPYMAVNALHRLKNPSVERYTYQRAIHAARDRFTPRYAHRHTAEEVSRWFRDAGFRDIEVVDWRSMPDAQQPTYQRNVGVRGIQKAQSDGQVAEESARAIHVG